MPNEKGNRYAIHALKDRRATMAGEIVQMKEGIAYREDQLGHLDAVLRELDPSYRADTLPPKKLRRVKLFGNRSSARRRPVYILLTALLRIFQLEPLPPRRGYAGALEEFLHSHDRRLWRAETRVVVGLELRRAGWGLVRQFDCGRRNNESDAGRCRPKENQGGRLHHRTPSCFAVALYVIRRGTRCEGVFDPTALP
jgi:hypothetical protein